MVGCLFVYFVAKFVLNSGIFASAFRLAFDLTVEARIDSTC
jgi:hypothetical protein